MDDFDNSGIISEVPDITLLKSDIAHDEFFIVKDKEFNYCFVDLHKISKAEKIIVAPIGLFAIICVVGASLQIYSTMSWTELLVLSPVILFTWAVFTAVVINFYLLIFKS